MKFNKLLLPFFILSFSVVFAQRSKIYTNELVDYNHASDLYQNKDYDASQLIFKKIKDQFDDASELKARSYYYVAFCAIRLGQNDADDLMRQFFEKFPTSTKRDNAFLEVGNYYFDNARYAYALKWFSRVDNVNLNSFNNEEYTFKRAYALFAVGSFANSKKYFSQLLNSSTYGAQAKYYSGYIAYRDDDYAEADKYLNQVADDKNFDDDIPYYMANIKFKTGKFQEAVDAALPLLNESNGIQHSELSKIIGESYFNLQEYEKAVPYLLEYKGKKGKWNNTDYYQLGYAYYKQQDYENALLWFSKIIDGNNAVSQNAYYHLAECYLKSGKKQEALNAFRNSKQMDFNADIKKDAWLNYAKLSYDIGNPYKSAAEVIQDYIKAYPETEEKSEIEELLISAYISNNDYQGALEYLNLNKGDKNNESYQNISYLYGIQLFNLDKFTDAVLNFDLSLENTPNLSYKAKAILWKAESNYRLNNFDAALNGFNNFIEIPESKTTVAYKNVHYQIAYTYFKIKDYNKAGGHFNEFINTNPENEKLLNDSFLRLGDCFFALSNYYKAIPSYQKVVDANETDVDYAEFQIALSHGFIGEIDKKINALQNFTETNLKSTLRDNAFYELGNSYVKKNEIDLALNSYNEVVQKYRMSSLVPKSLLKQGLVYYNSDQNEKALAKYKKVVERFPGTEEAREAIANAKQIYVDLGRVDEYESFIKTVDFVSITDEDLDNTMFASAEQFYLTNQFKKSIDAFQKYLKRFPNGINTLVSNFYLAESLSKNNKDDEAIPYYKFIIEKQKNEFTEQSLSKVALYHLKKEDWENAVKILSRLELEAETKENILFAQSNLMKGNYALKNHDKAVEYAEKVLQSEKLEDKIRSDAEIIIARSAFDTGDFLRAQDAFKNLEETANGEVKAEAIYYDAFFKNEEGNYKLSNVSIQKLVSEFSSYKYWGGKGLIIMAKNFYQLEDAYQATYILESVITKFDAYQDIVDEAKTELNKIKVKEAKTNSSVIIEKNP